MVVNMSSYGVVLVETVLGRDRIIRDFRRNPLKVDNKYMKKNNLCECLDYAYPVIRRLEIYEFDVLDSCEKDFENRLKTQGIEFRKRKMLSKITTFVWNIIQRKKNGNIEIFGKTGGILNSRSFVFAKKADEEYKTAKNFRTCARCKGNIPCDWT